MSVGSTSCSSGTAGIFQRLRSSASNGSSGTSQTQGASPTGGPPGGGIAGRVSKALEDQGITGDNLTSLREKIETAVKQAKSDSGDRDAVKSAVDGVLQDAGVDLDKFHEEVKPQGGGRGHGHGQRVGASGSGSQSPSIAKLLSQAGIDPSSFKSKLATMLQSGDVDMSSLFSGASSGTSLDVTG